MLFAALTVTHCFLATYKLFNISASTIVSHLVKSLVILFASFFLSLIPATGVR